MDWIAIPLYISQGEEPPNGRARRVSVSTLATMRRVASSLIHDCPYTDVFCQLT